MVKIQALTNDLTEKLKGTVPNARLEAEILVSFALKKDKLWLIMHKNDELSSDIAEYISELGCKRLSGMPIAYITGTKEFMSLEFTVNENVLIPRPETEELVSLIIDSSPKSKPIDILDLCSGSGAICCSLAYYLKNSRCVGVDIDTNTINTAKTNAANLGVEERCTIIQGDALKKLTFPQKFDIVVSNPPYIETDIVAKLDDTVKNFEPILALDGGNNGLMFYRAIIENIEFYLKDNGMIFFEIGYNQGKALKKLMAEKFNDISVVKDMAGLDRIVCAKLKPAQ